jgi:nucleotide-binding universal stress UspA family protein
VNIPENVTKYRRMMVTLDGSELAAQALPHARVLAGCLGAEVVLFRVIQTNDENMGAIEGLFTGMIAFEGGVANMTDTRRHEFVEKLVNDAATALEEVAIEFEQQNIPVQTVVQLGSPAAAIIDYADESDIDLIVMSTHGRTGVARWVYGSVADRVLRGASCPVLLVRSSID